MTKIFAHKYVLRKKFKWEFLEKNHAIKTWATNVGILVIKFETFKCTFIKNLLKNSTPFSMTNVIFSTKKRDQTCFAFT